MNLGFFGAGKMATAIARGLIDKHIWCAKRMAAVDVAPQARADFTAATGVFCGDIPQALVERSDIIVLAVKPQQAREAAASVAGTLGDRLLISIAAGLTIARLADWFDHRRIVRVMPNTPATVGQGMAVYACAEAATGSDRELTKEIFGAVGRVREAPESTLDAVTALSGSGPAYIFELIEALTQAGAAVGLDRELALELTLQTVLGSVAMVQQKVGDPEALRNAVTSPGGTTEAGLRVLRENGFREMLKQTVRAARDRSAELASG